MAAETLKTGVVDTCPDLETLAAYLDGRLDQADRDRMADHLDTCETCYGLFIEAAQVRMPESVRTVALEAVEPAPTPFWTKRRLVWSSAAAALATAAALVLMVGGGLLPRGRGNSPELQALVAAVGTDRAIEPRITGGFAYGPVRGSAVRGVESAAVVPPDVRIAAARIEKEAVARRTPQTLDALGISYLVMGDVNRAVPVLEEAADHPSPDARVLNDLAAAYLARAVANNQAQDFAKALAAADRAVKADPSLVEAWFNRAYALERLSLVDQARQAWQDYLKRDDRSGWASEARAHLRAVDAMPQSAVGDDEKNRLDEASRRGAAADVEMRVARAPDLAFEWLQDELLIAWPRAAAQPDASSSAGRLSGARLVARTLAGATGDRFGADTVAAIDAAGGTADARLALARAHQAFHAAITDYYGDHIRESMTKFEQVAAPLEHARSPYAVWAGLQLAIGEYYAGDLAEAERQLDAVIADATRRSYTRVAGLSYRVRGLIRVVRGDFAGGLEDYRTALEAFDRVGDRANQMSIRTLIAEDLEFLGESAEAWSERVHGLSQLSTVPDRRHRHALLQDAALASIRQDLPETALYFQRATLDNARRWNRPLAIFEATLSGAEIQRALGDKSAAVRELGSARAALESVPDRQFIARNEPRIQLAEAEATLQDTPRAAIATLSAALTGFEQSRRSWPMARVHLARARAYLRENRADLAEADLTAGIDLFERQRAAIADEALRSASFEQPWDLYSEMIRLQAVQRRPDAALAFAERARARTLLDARAGSSAQPVDPVIARKRLPASVAVLYYAALDDRLLVWMMTSGQMTFHDTPVRHADLAHLVEQFRSEIEIRTIPPRDTPSLRRLYDVLVGPVARELPDDAELVVVPDGVLHAVPFAALLRGEDRRFLIEQHDLQVAPSLTMFLDASRRATLFSADTSTLVLGNPTVSGSDAEIVPSLPQAEAEAREIAALYRSADLLIGPAATRRAFLDGAPVHAVVHFAGHAVANSDRPQLSRMLLAGGDAASRNLFARDIAAAPFPETRLVVLGACRTTAGRIRRGEGVFSMARPFLAAGVPTVVASLWDVNDLASRRLLVAFHRSLRQGGSVGGSLRRAQLELMADADPLMQNPESWAGFTVIGGRMEAEAVSQPRPTGR